MNKRQNETEEEYRARNAAYMKAYYARHGRKPPSEASRKRAVQRTRERRRDSPEYRARVRQWQRDYAARCKADGNPRIRTPEYNRTRDLKQKYNLTAEAHSAILGAQGGACAICRLPQSGRRMDVDHCHASKQVRGLLCRRCNLVLGHARDDSHILRAAAAYLDASRQ